MCVCVCVRTMRSSEMKQRVARESSDGNGSEGDNRSVAAVGGLAL